MTCLLVLLVPPTEKEVLPMTALALALALTALAPRPAVTPPDDLVLFLLTGQSGMSGRGLISEASYPPLDGIFTFGNDDTWHIAQESVDNALFQVDLLSSDGSLAAVGPAIPFALAYKAAHPGVNVGLIPCAKGGSRIISWSPDLEPGLYASCLRRIELARAKGELGGVLWWQGEAEAQHLSWTPGWNTRFASLVDAWRADTGLPGLPVVFARIRTEDPVLYPYTAEIRLQQESVDIPGVAMIDIDGLPMKDSVHVSTAGQQVAGARFATALLSLEGPPDEEEPPEECLCPCECGGAQ
jgi:hypothetical protein